MNLTNKEFAMLLLHMNIMRKEIKKALKRNYGLFEGKRKVACYDSITAALSEQLEQKGECDSYNIEFNDEQATMLHSFLSFYTQELKRQAERENIDYKENETLQLLESVLRKVEEGCAA
ncbi:hypothetical protein GGR02_001390 [Anoxybacillus voinovskiensis]|uniref:Uncharacterized protein n=1 Tax=Anoxybacteroides voinovskiense TaxID=230470 RepID=A0A840DUC8_9BACL|nr:hypothetical protein [Anoxybacillus voinovskiensis]MBB4073628.1 hypothetical protein [Anoxybacillus voinovskiensis]GGJ63349.1 hypothetical protein GCM10008982_10660 [Anoxybacillus voinovskiensis]